MRLRTAHITQGVCVDKGIFERLLYPAIVDKTVERIVDEYVA
jgi:hypothetical protein